MHLAGLVLSGHDNLFPRKLRPLLTTVCSWPWPVWVQPAIQPKSHFFCYLFSFEWASLVAQVKNPPANAGDMGSIPGSGKSPGGGNGNPLQYPCLEKSTDRGSRQATVHRVAKEPDKIE